MQEALTPAHGVEGALRLLRDAGGRELREPHPWTSLEAGQLYYTRRGRGALAAWIQPRGDFSAFQMAAAHTDSPCLQLRCGCEEAAEGIVKVPVEVYGSPILSSWLDRPLTVAGEVVHGKGSSLEVSLFRSEGPWAVIPNVAVHLEKPLKEGKAYNPQTELPALLGALEEGEEAEGSLLRRVAQEMNLAFEDIRGADLYLVDGSEPEVVGPRGEFWIASRQDNQLSAAAEIMGLLDFYTPGIALSRAPVVLLFNHEEIGSRTREGADGSLMMQWLERISGGSREDFLRRLSQSKLLSVDSAHAAHPNYPGHYQKNRAPRMNGGPALKYAAARQYATDAVNAAWLGETARRAQVPLQRFEGRADKPLGSTVGPVSAAFGGADTVDLGLPLWAMHSLRETGGTADPFHLYRLMQEYFKESTLS